MPVFTPNLIANAVIAILGIFLLLCAKSDLVSRRIPNQLVFIGAGVGVLLNSALPEGFGFMSALPGALGFWHALAGLALGLVLLLPLYMLRAMGAGDVKLMAMVGAFIGPNAIVNTVLITFIAGGILALFVGLKNNVLRQMFVNLREMLLGAYFKLTMNETPTVDAPARTAARMPYALAIATGTFAYVVLVRLGHMPLINVM
ncbi:MAG: A24 family peptidase [Burkholderiales bacterium]